MKTIGSGTIVTSQTEIATPKVIRQRQRTSRNTNTTNEQRMQLIDLIMRTSSIRQAAKTVGMNESTAKSIYYNYTRSGNFLRKNLSKFEPKVPEQ